VEVKEFGGTCPAIVVHVADLPLTFNQRVVGSIPTALTKQNQIVIETIWNRFSRLSCRRATIWATRQVSSESTDSLSSPPRNADNDVAVALSRGQRRLDRVQGGDGN
jgi:hypothetical protein